MSTEWQTLTTLLVHIQAHLECDLSLEALAARTGYSPYHLHRMFTAVIGETPKAYCARLRLERAAFRLHLHEVKVLDLALDCGYHSAETFSRAFSRRFSMSPSEYRARVQSSRSTQGRVRDDSVAATATRYEISATKVLSLRPVQVAFIRHVGPYEKVPESLFDELAEWADRHSIGGPRVWMGIGHDAPGVTPSAQLRFDVALVVSQPFAPSCRVGCQSLPGGDYAITTHAGPYDTLPEAYAAVFPKAVSIPGYEFVGLPALEIYHSAQVNVRFHLNHTDICLPVRAAKRVRS